METDRVAIETTQEIRRVNDEEIMVWLESSLERARGRGQEKLVRLMEAVRVEVIFEMELLEAEARRTQDQPRIDRVVAAGCEAQPRRRCSTERAVDTGHGM